MSDVHLVSVYIVSRKKEANLGAAVEVGYFLEFLSVIALWWHVSCFLAFRRFIFPLATFLSGESYLRRLCQEFHQCPFLLFVLPFPLIFHLVIYYRGNRTHFLFPAVIHQC